ncbi:MAG TPA: cupin domain-containing protein [Candidatus Cybelea sp.]|nr:cupin domain-containing protein [Candidatus Cybelea sp.]
MDRAVAELATRSDVVATIERLKAELRASDEPFVWATIDVGNVPEIPDEIQSAWIFVLRAGRWSGAHYHPNSVQHMAVIEGCGRSNIGGAIGEMAAFGDDGSGERWFVIEPGVPHEFFPEDGDMVVMSFHTAAAQELLEVSQSGVIRHYEWLGDQPSLGE